MNNIIALAASLYIYTALIVNILENGLYSKHLTFHYRVSVLLNIEISRDIYLFFHWDDSSRATTRIYYIQYIISI